MSYTALENTPIVIDLLQACNDTGWTISGDIASHSSCNADSIKLQSYTVKKGNTYRVSYAILTISGGYCQLQSPGSNGVTQTTADLYVETITPTADGYVSFYSNANCTLQAFNIQNTANSTSNYQEDTLVYSVADRKWLFRTIAPDYGFSIAVDMLTLYQGNLYLHENGSDDRNTFYGVPYQTIIEFVDNTAPTVPKSFLSLSIQSNQLMVTGDDGITTSLGQVSELSSIDFVKDFLTDGTSSVAVQTIEGVYSAGFLRDKNDDLIIGTPLKGNWIKIRLISTENSPLQLFTVNIVGRHSPIGSR